MGAYPRVSSMRVNIRFISPGGQEVVLSESVVTHLLAHRQKLCGREAGGQLFGVFEDSRTVCVLKATGPRKTDLRWPFFYRPDKIAEQIEIDEAFRSNLHYVGDWHTHPQDIPSPSGYDIESLQRIFCESQHKLNYLVLAVVGRTSTSNGIYLGLVDSQNIITLSPVRGS